MYIQFRLFLSIIQIFFGHILTNNENIIIAAQKLLAGNVVAFPTETVYGLGADASNPLAVRQIFAKKDRPADHPLIVHFQSVENATKWARFGKEALLLAKEFWPGPLTMILPKKNIAPREVTGGLDTIGVRIPAHPVAQELLRVCNRPIAAPSANKFGRISPTTAAHVREEFGASLFILDGGPCQVGIESTIIDLTSHPSLLRPGVITKQQVELIVGQLNETSTTKAPGTLEAHYAPLTSLYLSETPQQDAKKFISQGRKVEIMWATSPREYAQKLYAELRRLDALGVDILIAEKSTDNSIGLAINDRLHRASVGSQKDHT